MNNEFDYKKLAPFKWFVLENFPFIEADFDALTNWQLFCKLGQEMNKIINSQNKVGKQVEVLTNEFNKLVNYVNNYFTNLNVQNEINNKLDIMAEDGTLSKIINEDIFKELNDKIAQNTSDINNLDTKITQNTSDINNLDTKITQNTADINIINSNKINYVNNIEELKNNTNLKDNNIVFTKGFYNISDGGNAKYLITSEELIPDNYTIFALQNNLYAKLIPDNIVNVKQFGAKGDNVSDDVLPINKCLEYCSENNIETYIPSGIYLVSNQVLLNNNNHIIGENRDTTIIKTKANTDLVYNTVVNESAKDINARICRNENSSDIAKGYPSVEDVCNHYNYGIIVENLTIDGNWQNRDLKNWNYLYNDIRREPGMAIQFKRVYNSKLKNLLVINAPQHCIDVSAGSDSYNQGKDFVADYPSYNILITECETNNQRYDDGITTHDSEYIIIEKCYTHVDNNANFTYKTPISNGIEIDDGSRHIKVLNCLSRYSVAGYQAKGHSNSPSAKDVLFENCTAECCQCAIDVSQNFSLPDWSLGTDEQYNIVIKNFTSKNMYIFKNSPLDTDTSFEILSDGGRGLLVDGYNTTFGNPKNNKILNIKDIKRNNIFNFRLTCHFYNLSNINIYKSQNDNFSLPLFNVRGTSRNFIFQNIFCEGCTGDYAMIDYTNDSTDGYCILNNIILIQRNNNDKIYNIGSSNLGTKTNCLLLNAQ